MATSYNNVNVGSVHEELGQLEQAKDYHQRSLEIRLKALCPTYVDVASSFSNLDLVFRNRTTGSSKGLLPTIIGHYD